MTMCFLHPGQQVFTGGDKTRDVHGSDRRPQFLDQLLELGGL